MIEFVDKIINFLKQSNEKIAKIFVNRNNFAKNQRKILDKFIIVIIEFVDFNNKFEIFDHLIYQIKFCFQPHSFQSNVMLNKCA